MKHPTTIQKPKNWWQAFLWRVFGKPYWRRTESEINHPCFVAVCAWCKERADAGHDDVGWIWYTRDHSHWETPVRREDRRHAVGVYRGDDGRIHFHECLYPPLGDIVLSEAERESIEQWVGPGAEDYHERHNS